MPDLLGVTTGSRLIAMIVMHHHAGFRGQVLLSESMLSLVVVDKGDNIGEVLTGEIDLFAQSLFLGGYHRRRVTASQRNLILTLLLNVPKGRGFFIGMETVNPAVNCFEPAKCQPSGGRKLEQRGVLSRRTGAVPPTSPSVRSPPKALIATAQEKS